MKKKLALFFTCLCLFFVAMSHAVIILAQEHSATSETGGLSLSDWEYTIKDQRIILTKYISKNVNVIIPSTFAGHEDKTVEIKCKKRLGELFDDLLSPPAPYYPYKILESLKIGTSDKKVKWEANSLACSFCGFVCLKNIDLRGLDTSRVTNMQSMFFNCQSLHSVDLSGLDTKHVTDINSMFADCWNLKSINFSGFDTHNVTNMIALFRACHYLKSIDLSGFDTSNVAYMNNMFRDCFKLEYLDLHHFDTRKVENMDGMFADCKNLKGIKGLEQFDTSNVKQICRMFHGCRSLKNINVSSFDTSKVIFLSNMFSNCDNLETIEGLDHFDTSTAISTDHMFWNSPNLKELDLSSFDTSHVHNMESMFAGCTNLQSIKGLEKLFVVNKSHKGTSSVEKMLSNCTNLHIIDLSSLKASEKTDISKLFDCENCMDRPASTIIISTDQTLIDAYDGADRIVGRTPYAAKVIYNGNNETWLAKSAKKEAILKAADHFIYPTMADARKEFTFDAATILKDSPKITDKEGFVSTWYLDEACTMPFDETGSIDFTILTNGTLHLYAGYKKIAEKPKEPETPINPEVKPTEPEEKPNQPAYLPDLNETESGKEIGKEEPVNNLINTENQNNPADQNTGISTETSKQDKKHTVQTGDHSNRQMYEAMVPGSMLFMALLIHLARKGKHVKRK